MIDKKTLRTHFGKQARHYDSYAVVQKKMAEELISMVTCHFNDKSAIRILDVGCGTGYLTEKLLECFPNAAVTAVDIAPGMIDYAKQKLTGSNVSFKCLDIEDDVLSGTFDLIISNATFQWFNHPEKTIEKLRSMLTHGGILAFSTFGEKTFNELHASYSIAKDRQGISSSSQPGQSFQSLESLENICLTRLLGGSLERKETYEYEYFESTLKFLESVKKVGANNCNTNRACNPALVRDMIETYDRTFKEGGLVRATYHCLYLCLKVDALGGGCVA